MSKTEEATQLDTPAKIKAWSCSPRVKREALNISIMTLLLAIMIGLAVLVRGDPRLRVNNEKPMSSDAYRTPGSDN